MNHFASFVLSLFLSAAVVSAADRREIVEELAVDGEQTVRIEIPVGDIRVEAVEGSTLKADLNLKCRWARRDCGQVLDDVELEVRSSARRLRLELSGLPRWHKSKLEVEGLIGIPRSAPLEVDMGVGELEIRGTQNGLWVDLGVGRVEARLPRTAVGVVILDVGVGQAELFGSGLRVEGQRPYLVGSEIYWDEGPGRARVEVDLGVGEIALHLD